MGRRAHAEGSSRYVRGLRGLLLPCSLPGALGGNCHAGPCHQRRLALDSSSISGLLLQGDTGLRAGGPAIGLIMVGKQILHIEGWGSISWPR